MRDAPSINNYIDSVVRLIDLDVHYGAELEMAHKDTHWKVEMEPSLGRTVTRLLGVWWFHVLDLI